MGLEAVRRLRLPSFTYEAGDLTVIEALPFEIRRAFFIHNVPAGARRGSHANRDEHVFVAMSGSLELFLDDGTKSDSWALNRPDEGLYVPPLVWRELRSFTASTTCLVLSSRLYSADDYIRDYDQFLVESGNRGRSTVSDGDGSRVSDRELAGKEDRQ